MLRDRLRRDVEHSRIRSRLSSLLSWITATSVGSFGTLVLLWGGFSTAILIATPANRPAATALLGALILLCASIPLLRAHQSLGYALRHSRAIGGLLFGFCGLSPYSCTGGREGKERRWWALLGAVALTVLDIRFGVSRVFAVCLGIALLMLIFTVPELSAVGVLLFLPFFEYLPHPTVLLTAGVLLSDLVWLCKAVSGRRRLALGAIDLAVLLLCLSFALSGVGASAGEGLARAILTSFFFPVRNLLHDAVWKRRAILAICLSGGLCGSIGVLQYALGLAELRWVDVSRFSDIGGRVTGPFSNPNIFAVFLLLSAPFLLAASADRSISRLKRMLSAAGLLAVLGALIFTFTRGAWIGFLIAFALFCLFFDVRWATYLALSPLALPVLFPLLPSGVVNRFSSISSLGESSIRYRLYTWRGVLRLIAEHPMGIGIGRETFSRVYVRYAVSGTEGVVHTHQLMLQILTEQGVAGLLILVLILGLLLLSAAWSLPRLRDGERGELVAALCALVGVLVMGLFDYVWYHFGMLCLFFAVAAMIGLPSERMLEREGELL